LFFSLAFSISIKNTRYDLFHQKDLGEMNGFSRLFGKLRRYRPVAMPGDDGHPVPPRRGTLSKPAAW
jgi:hypothetical protein